MRKRSANDRIESRPLLYAIEAICFQSAKSERVRGTHCHVQGEKRKAIIRYRQSTSTGGCSVKMHSVDPHHFQLRVEHVIARHH